MYNVYMYERDTLYEYTLKTVCRKYSFNALRSLMLDVAKL